MSEDHVLQSVVSKDCTKRRDHHGSQLLVNKDWTSIRNYDKRYDLIILSSFLEVL